MGWLERLFGSQDNEPIQMPSVGHPAQFGSKNASPLGQFGSPSMPGSPSMFANPEGQLNSVPGQVSMVPRAAAPTPVPAPRRGMTIQRPDMFADPEGGLPEILAGDTDPDVMNAPDEQPGMVEGESFEPWELAGAQNSDVDFNLSEADQPTKMPPNPTSPMAKMSGDGGLPKIDPFASNMEGQDDGVIQAIHKAMQTHKMKQGGFNPKTAYDPMSDALDPQSAQFRQMANLPEEAEMLPESPRSGGWGDGTAPMLQGIAPIQSQTPQFNKQGLFKALLSRMH